MQDAREVGTIHMSLNEASVAGAGPSGLGFKLTSRAAKQLARLSNESGLSFAETMRIAFGLVWIAIDETKAGNRLVVTSPDGRAIKEIVLPLPGSQA